MEGLIFGGAYVRREICVSKSIGRSTGPRGAYIWRGDLTEGFLRYRFGGLIFGGAYTWKGLFSEFYGNLRIRKKSYVISLSVPSSFQ